MLSSASLFLLCVSVACAQVRLNKTSLVLAPATAEQLRLEGCGNARWESSAPQVARVFPNGFVIGLQPGKAKVVARAPGGNAAAECKVTVQAARPELADPAKLQQYPDSREFVLNGRHCFGSELNGERAFQPEERRHTHLNRVVNPRPLVPDKPLEWEVQAGTEVFDGAGVLMGTVPAWLKVGERLVPTSKFNFGMSKILNGRLCLYAFSIWMKPSPAIAELVDPAEVSDGAVGTSAWLPLDRVVEKELLLERIGVGKTKLLALPLESRSYRITGGNPKLYLSEHGEMSIVKAIGSGPVPSHYLRRPSGTVNIIYSVPGFGLGGQGLDSFLVSDGIEFYPAKGAKVFVQPTYFPPKHPQAGQVSPQTMTFLYGAAKVKGCEPVYGWVAKEALSKD